MAAFAAPVGRLATSAPRSLPARSCSHRPRPGVTMGASPPPPHPPHRVHRVDTTAMAAAAEAAGAAAGGAAPLATSTPSSVAVAPPPPKRKAVCKAGIVTTTTAPGLTEVHHHMGALGADDGRFPAAVAHHAATLRALERRGGGGDDGAAAAAAAPRRRWLLRRLPERLDGLPDALPAAAPAAQALVVMEAWADPPAGGRPAAAATAAARWAAAMAGCRRSLATTPVVSLTYDTVTTVCRGGGGVGNDLPLGAVVVCEVVNAAAAGEAVADALRAVLVETAAAVVQNDQALSVSVLRADEAGAPGGGGGAFFKTVEVYRSAAHWRDHCDGLDAAFLTRVRGLRAAGPRTRTVFEAVPAE